MKLSIIKHEEKKGCDTEVYTLKTKRGNIFEIIIDHYMHETLIVDLQRESIIHELYGVYLNNALRELSSYVNGVFEI